MMGRRYTRWRPPPVTGCHRLADQRDVDAALQRLEYDLLTADGWHGKVEDAGSSTLGARSNCGSSFAAGRTKGSFLRLRGPSTEVIVYTDDAENFHGFLAFCGHDHRLAVGGLRVQPGLQADTIAALAQTMWRKERLLGLAADGAKAGIDYDPASTGARDAVRRFLGFLRPHLEGRLSLGPDLGSHWDEIESLARAEGIPSLKMAVARAQGLDPIDFHRRLDVLDEVIGGRTVGQRRAGHALAHAALGTCEHLGTARRELRVGIQGFGTVGRAAAQSFDDVGARLVAVSDERGCLLDDGGIDVAALLVTPHAVSVVRRPPPGTVVVSRRLLFDQPLDVLVLAATENAVSPAQAATLAAPAVVVGANLGLCADSEQILHRRGILVVPDFVAGCGGSASMDALFGPSTCPRGRQLLDQVGLRMRELVGEILVEARRLAVTPREAALALSQAHPVPAGHRPYGRWRPRPVLAPVPTATGESR